MKFIERIIEIFVKYETKTIAGAINFILAIGFLILSILVYTSVSVFDFFGFKDSIKINALLCLLTTAFFGYLSMWALSKYDYQSKLLKK